MPAINKIDCVTKKLSDDKVGYLEQKLEFLQEEWERLILKIAGSSLEPLLTQKIIIWIKMNNYKN